VEDLDRILDRQDVLPARAVDVVDHRRKGGRLACARGAGDEDETPVIRGELLHAEGQRERLEARDFFRDDAERERDRAALAEAVDAEAGLLRVGERHVQLARAPELVQLRREVLRQTLDDPGEILRTERGPPVQHAELAVAANDRGLAELEVDVRAAKLDDALQKLVEIDHAQHIGRRGFPL
jgi:hypothetical protein